MPKEKIHYCKKTKKVTNLPCFILKIKGRLDAKHDDGVCNEYVTRLHKKLSAIESEEVVIAEKILFPYRKEAAVILSNFDDFKKNLEEIPAMIDENSIDSIRENKRNMLKRNSIKQNIKKSIERLTIIYETIININTVLDEQIHKTEKMSEVKIKAYVSGIRYVRNDEYSVPQKLENIAVEIYHDRHEVLDNRICMKVTEFMGRERA